MAVKYSVRWQNSCRSRSLEAHQGEEGCSDWWLNLVADLIQDQQAQALQIGNECSSGSVPVKTQKHPLEPAYDPPTSSFPRASIV